MRKDLSEKEFFEHLEKIGWLKDGQINYENYNIEHPKRDIKSSDTQKIRNATIILCEMIKAERKAAMKILFAAFEDYRNEYKKLEIIADNLAPIENNEYIDFIFNFLGNTKSNATSRNFIKILILFFTQYYKNERVIEQLEVLCKSKSFTYRMKKHFKHAKNAVEGISNFSFYEENYK